jgi:signal transduction protein with GAF and PtsI domain
VRARSASGGRRGRESAGWSTRRPIVDGVSGDVSAAPPDIKRLGRAGARARRQAQYRALRERPCVTKDGENIALMINAGLTIDLPHIAETGAAGIGLFRTELQFMVAPTLPRTGEQSTLYRTVLDAAGKKPVTFRTLDIGGDKVLPYMRNFEEENPALGWRAIRLGLDGRLMRSQMARRCAPPRRTARDVDGRGWTNLTRQDLVEHELTCAGTAIRCRSGSRSA